MLHPFPRVVSTRIVCPYPSLRLSAPCFHTVNVITTHQVDVKRIGFPIPSPDPNRKQTNPVTLLTTPLLATPFCRDDL